ncbi:hypothetical protein GCM10023311_14650 [Flaviramulus aquimarinus]|uniref:Uncharacterized protein n=2 Tax=Flaviramulus aquimarinus TaxID=1170456 RepID=A0ABP9F2J3_9FLAO
MLKKVYTKTDKYPQTPAFEQKTSLDFIQLTVKEKNYKKLKRKRDKALTAGILETNENDYVPATITFNGKDYKAEIRLKGDWTDHLKDDKWSFRVKLKNDQTILGMRKFSIHNPKTRLFINEWLLHKAIKKEDLIGLRYHFIEGSIHIKKENSSQYISKNVGVYALEETFDKRTIESNKRKESIILKFSEDYWWQEVKKSIEVGSTKGMSWNKFMDQQLDINNNLRVMTFSEDKVLADSTMLNYFKLSKNLIEDLRKGNLTIDKVFDVKELALQNAILNLFGAAHGNYIINVRFYYNPITSMLEPITFDGNAGVKLKKYQHFLFANQQKDSVYLKALANALYKVSKPTFLNSLIEENKEEISFYSEIIKKEFKVKGIAVQNLKYNQNILKKELERLIIKFNIKNIPIEKDSNLAVKKIIKPKLTSWINNGSQLLKTAVKRNNEDVYTITRKSNSKPAYSVIANNNTAYGETYKASILVKKGDLSPYFGLRVQGQFPNRVDAIFNLNNGVLKEVKSFGDFNREQATIKALGNGWYKCEVSVKVKSNNVSIILGPTSGEKKVNNWEGITNTINNVNIIPSSLTLQKMMK